jgi:hypothetical protein
MHCSMHLLQRELALHWTNAKLDFINTRTYTRIAPPQQVWQNSPTTPFLLLVHICTCMWVPIHTHTPVLMYVCTYTHSHSCPHVCMYLYTLTLLSSCMYVPIHTHSCPHVCEYLCTLILLSSRTYIRTHIVWYLFVTFSLAVNF